MRAAPVLRCLRAGVFAVLCVALAASAHGLAMGAVPTLRTMSAASAVVFVLSFLAASRERSLAAICGAMALVQVGLHLLFDATAGGSSVLPGTTGAAAMANMAMANIPGMGAMPGMDGPAVPVPPHAMSGSAVVAHALAALAAAWWLRCGEAAVWALVRCAAALVPGPAAWVRARVVPPAVPPRVPAPGHVDGPSRKFPLLLRHAVIRRGPPRGSLPVPTG
ncbi:hypothetical protein ACEZCY_29460 [Streptacidiphilus sp. N1-12]|uniref:Uncharacterized protein n=2 Tax=Streptacidiphilus alkalitolerans TaxID=3342712 RepID=A0ABV6WMW2_9ACTN